MGMGKEIEDMGKEMKMRKKQRWVRDKDVGGREQR